MTQQPFALFVISEISVKVGTIPAPSFSCVSDNMIQDLNDLLSQAYEEDSAKGLLFLASKADLTDAPCKRADDAVNDGIDVPISDYASPLLRLLSKLPLPFEMQLNILMLIDNYSLSLMASQ